MRQLVIKSGKYLLLFILTTLTFTSCNEESSQVPEVHVNFTINTNMHNELQVPGGSVYIPGVGFGGIIVSHHIEGEYYAYDATCTHEISQSCHIEPEGLIATCPCCNSKYTLFYSAFPVEGPASAPLKQYNVSVMNNYTLRIYN